MNIPVHYRNRFVYHFTHIANLPDIVKHGLLSTNEKKARRIRHRGIAHESIQTRRANMEVSCGFGGVVHDYVPFYFCKRSPMLYAVVWHNKAPQQDIIYLEVPITVMVRYPCVFADASANTISPPNFYEDPLALDEIDWDAVETRRWSTKHNIAGHRTVTERKQAELLVYRWVPPSVIERITVWDSKIEERVRQIYDDVGLQAPPVKFGYDEYYFRDEQGNSIAPGSASATTSSMWQGYEDIEPPPEEQEEVYYPYAWEVAVVPRHNRVVPSASSVPKEQPEAVGGRNPKRLPALDELAKGYNEASNLIRRHTGWAKMPSYQTPEDLLGTLRDEFTCLKQTRMLIGVVVHDNGRAEDVAEHSKRVADVLRERPAYTRWERTQQRTNQVVCELAAYLQDTGYQIDRKSNSRIIHVQADPSHPLLAMVPLAQILVYNVGKISDYLARILPLLVCFHNTLADIVTGQRTIDDLASVVLTTSELEMLIALGTADMQARDEHWCEHYGGEIKAIWQQALRIVLDRKNVTSGTGAP